MSIKDIGLDPSPAESDSRGKVDERVADHYGGHLERESDATLVQRIDAALRETGRKDPIPTAILATLDQFHVGGLQSTLELARMAQIRRGERVIDIGSGLGGPSRYLAEAFECQVLGIDLSPYFVAASTYLAGRSGLKDKVSYVCASALDLPASAVGFDLAWTQHVAMNIEDRAGLYRSVFNALKPGGRFAIHDIVAGEQGSPHYPLPWARSASTSFLLSPADMRSVLERTGFKVVHWMDQTAAALAWFQQQAAAPEAHSGSKPLGLSLAMGPDFPQLLSNLARSLREGRVGIVQAILVRP